MRTIGYFPILAWTVAILLFSCVPSRGTPQIADLHLLPVPSRITMGQGKLSINASFRVRMSGYEEPRIKRAVTQFLQRLQRRTGVSFLLPSAADPKQAAFEIYCSRVGERIQSMREDESYALEVTNQSASLVAPAPIGVLRGLETFLQLVDLDDQSFFIPSLKIEDRPRFCWRGLLIDASRHWEPLEVIRRNLDAMAAVKMNVFHWHLSDDQGFRIESKIFPRLHQAGSDGKYYSQGEVRDIIAYARDRGIRVIPEFDMPGHTTAWLVAYPDLASVPGPYQIERAWGVFDPCMDPSREKLYSFLDSFIGEMAGLFPDEYFHIGGDEVNGKQWTSSPRIRDFKARKGIKNNHDLQAYFNQRLLKILIKHGKKMIGWDEILHPSLPKNIIIQSWRGQASLADSARRGYGGILSYGFYLDHMQPASFHYAADPLGGEAANLTEEEKPLVLGGEACMWGEFVNPENIESRIWPRTAAIAERLWSPSEVRDVQEIYRRLEYVNRELESLGLYYRARYFEMLQRMAGDQDAAPLITFAGLLKPTGLGVRQRTQRYSSLTPLNRLVDVVMPESDTARQFETLTEKILANGREATDSYQQVRELFVRWIENDARLKSILEQSFLLSDTGPLAEIIAALGKCGMQALDYLGSHQKPSDAWRRETASLFERAEKPQAEILMAIAPSIKRLVDAANAIP